MPNRLEKYRVFLSYRGKTEGMAFAQALYHHLKDDVPFSNEKYGEIYFSPETDPFGNFKTDIPYIMSHVEFFVMPLTEDYFSDFIDEVGTIREEDAITYRELRAALDKKRKDKDSIHFICVTFPGYQKNPALLKKLFGKDAIYILCAKSIPYHEESEIELFRKLGDRMIKADLELPGAFQILSKDTPNIFLSFKKDTENQEKYPLFDKLYDVTRITFLNYASTTFVSGIDVAEVYKESDDLKRLFWEGLARGTISVDMVLTDPHSYAAQDSVDHKMFPLKQTIDSNRIIIHNLNLLLQFKHKHPKANLQIWLTQIALPYGIMVTEHKNIHNNHMKVDMYAALPANDGYRPSFYMRQDELQTRHLYEFFSSNIDKIRAYSMDFSDGHPDFAWLLSKNIIHRGVLSPELTPHTRGAFEACMEHGYPMEVDLLRLRDNTIVIGRDDHDMTQYGFNGHLSECNRRSLAQLNASVPKSERIFRLDEFCDFISDRIPVLFEIKVDNRASQKDIEAYVGEIVKTLRTHFRRSPVKSTNNIDWYVQKFAIHSANPYAIKSVKELDCIIPCGIISTDFSKKDGVTQEFVNMHQNADYMKIVQPDFLCYDILYMENGIARRESKKAGIPLLAWTIKDRDGQYDAKSLYKCDNIIIEGATSFGD